MKNNGNICGEQHLQNQRKGHSEQTVGNVVTTLLPPKVQDV